MNAKFVDMTAGARTYVAHLNTNVNFSGVADAATRSDRKSAAWQTQRSAEQSAMDSLTPRLDALKAAGLVQDYELVSGTGQLIINATAGKAGAAYQALQGLGELGRVLRNREVLLDDQQQGTVAPTADPTVEWNVDKLGVQKVWAAGDTGQGVVIGMVDTGVNTQHEALKGHYRGTNADGTQTDDYNFYDPVGNKKVAYDDHNHGSHTAGTAVGGTADHLTGMAPGAKFIATKVFTAGGSGSTATILKGLGWMLAPTDSAGLNPDPTKAPDIVSNSWGSSDGKSLAYLDALKAFEAAGIVPVFAAGNSGPRAGTVGSPGSLAQAVTIGATDKDDKVASFSSRGPSPIKDKDGNVVQKPDFSAPGVDVISSGKDGNSYVKMSGTSMATPAAAGVIALLISKYPKLTTEQVREVLAKSAGDVDAPGTDLNTGAGRLDPVAAIALADKLYGTPVPPAQPAPVAAA
ncbi:MAG: S8 family serine peptidase [Thermoleophilia bacterium]|nr:S8 family serine peptidase [Thermoleophilia bacterium]